MNELTNYLPMLLSQVALTEIIGVVLAYAIKSLVENLSKNNNWPDKARKDETTHE